MVDVFTGVSAFGDFTKTPKKIQRIVNAVKYNQRNRNKNIKIRQSKQNGTQKSRMRWDASWNRIKREKKLLKRRNSTTFLIRIRIIMKMERILRFSSFFSFVRHNCSHQPFIPLFMLCLLFIALRILIRMPWIHFYRCWKRNNAPKSIPTFHMCHK